MQENTCIYYNKNDKIKAEYVSASAARATGLNFSLREIEDPDMEKQIQVRIISR